MKKTTVQEHTKRILVPIDFSEQSVKALDQAVEIAKMIKAEIVMLSVIEDGTSMFNMMKKSLNVTEATNALLKHQDSLFSRYSDSGVRMEPMVSRGEVHMEIAKTSEMLAPELVVMGTNGKPEDFSKRFVGSIAYRVSKEVSVPLISIHGDAQVKEINRIVFPYMLHRKSKEKVGLCLHYARIFDAEVYVVALAEDIKEQKQLPLHVNQIQKYISEHGVNCQAHIEPNEGRSYPETFLAYTKQIYGDLIIIMEDESVAPFHLWASDLEEVMYNAEVPVLCVNPQPVKYGSGFSNF